MFMTGRRHVVMEVKIQFSILLREFFKSCLEIDSVGDTV